MINREKLLNSIKRAFNVHRIVCLLGPKGSGKKTIASALKKTYAQVHWFDLKKWNILEAFESPDLLLSNLRGLIVIDEIERRPNLFGFLKYLHDKHFGQNFLILGNVKRKFIKQSKESLAGRISHIEMPSLSLNEVNDMERLWLRGGFPDSYSASGIGSLVWREEYILLQIEHTLAAVGFKYDFEVMKKQLELLAVYYNGLSIRYADLARSLQISQPTVKKYLSYLEGGFMIRLLNPWHENLKKRQVRSYKMYFRDSGLINFILGIKTSEELYNYPTIHKLFGGFAIEQVVKFHDVDSHSCYFWESHNRSSLDLLIMQGDGNLGFEFTVSKNPKLTRSMKIAMKDLKLKSLTVIYPKGESYMLADNIKVISLEEYLNV